jgi:hypothetical protein
MASEKSHEQRFAEIYPLIYYTLRDETFTEEDWKVNLAIEASQQVDTLSPLQKDFFSAIRAPEIEAVKLLIEREIEAPEFKLSWLLSTIDYWQITNPLSPAQPYFSAEIQSLIWNLIISHSNPNNLEEILSWGIATHQSKEIIDAFINAVGDIDSQDNQGLTFLHLACFFNQVATIESLLHKQANVDKKDKSKNLPLHIACANNHPGIVRRLLSSMRDKSCIPDILQHGAIYSEEIEALLLDCTPTQKPTLDAFVQHNAQVQKKTSEIKKCVPLLLLPDVTLRWNAAVATAEAETEAKKQKCTK